jgi:hypothetical protein
MLPHQSQKTCSHSPSIADLFRSFVPFSTVHLPGIQMGIHTVAYFIFASTSFVISLFTPKVYVFDFHTFLDLVLASTPCHEVMRSQAVKRNVSWLVLTAHLLHQSLSPHLFPYLALLILIITHGQYIISWLTLDSRSIEFQLVISEDNALELRALSAETKVLILSFLILK